MREATTGVDGRERLGQHHAEALAAERRRAEQVGLAEQAPLLLLGDAPGDLDALGVEQQRLDLELGGAGDREAGVDAGAAQRLEGAQQHGQALAPLGAADEEDVELLVGAAALGRAALRSTPFGTIR